MKKIFGLILLLFFTVNSFGSTEVSRFVEKQYAAECKLNKVHIVVKKEYTTDYPQTFAENTAKLVTYGYGDMKIKGRKKFRISYICLSDKNSKPFWSQVIKNK